MCRTIGAISLAYRHKARRLRWVFPEVRISLSPMPAIAASVALAPFDNLSGDPAQDVLARGFVEDIASALSRFGTLEVVYPRATATAGLADAAVSPASMATTVLRGSVRRAGDVIRIAVQLLDAQGGRQIWADRYDVRGPLARVRAGRVRP